MKVRRLLDRPIITAAMDDRLGANINGPSPMAVPDWIDNPLGRFYLYFADHRGLYIRLAYADAVSGPWRIHAPGCLDLADSLFATEDLGSPAQVGKNFTYAHVASPDVHAVSHERQIRLYYHGLTLTGEQMTRVAVSDDGLTFRARPGLLGPTYFRCFVWRGKWYALTHPDQVFCSGDGLDGFHPVGALGDPGIRHTAVMVRGDLAHVFFSRIGDAPERILRGAVNLAAPETEWRLENVEDVITAEADWEGGHLPITPSVAGAAREPVNQLRDPGVLDVAGRAYLFYSTAGESGIGVAALMGLS